MTKAELKLIGFIYPNELVKKVTLAQDAANQHALKNHPKVLDGSFVTKLSKVRGTVLPDFEVCCRRVMSLNNIPDGKACHRCDRQGRPRVSYSKESVIEGRILSQKARETVLRIPDENGINELKELPEEVAVWFSFVHIPKDWHYVRTAINGVRHNHGQGPLSFDDIDRILKCFQI